MTKKQKERELAGLRRLMTLARFLRKLPPKRFKFNEWVGGEWGGKPDLSCGTTACALGWATTIPSFRRQGLKLIKDHGGYSGFHLPVYRKATGLDVAIDFFDIPLSVAAHLFVPAGHYANDDENALPASASANDVADQIEQYIAQRRKELSSKKP